MFGVLPRSGPSCGCAVFPCPHCGACKPLLWVAAGKPSSPSPLGQAELGLQIHQGCLHDPVQRFFPAKSQLHPTHHHRDGDTWPGRGIQGVALCPLAPLKCSGCLAKELRRLSVAHTTRFTTE